MIGFHTPARQRPLNLDLAELSGGGSCPTQFEGKTHDGRDVYVRYRGGRLSVQIAESEGGDVHDAEPLVDAGLGPIYHGDISLAQFCRLFGVTINGAVPEEGMAEEAARLDLSGSMTFFRASLAQMTPVTAKAIARAALEHIPGGKLFQGILNEAHRTERFAEVTPEEISAFRAFVVTGLEDSAQLEEITPMGMAMRPGQLHLKMTYTRWQYPEPLYTSREADALKDLGRAIFVAGMRDLPPEHVIAHETLQMAADFPTTDEKTRACLAGLEPLIAAHFPQTPMVKIDISTGKIVGREASKLDRTLAEWCMGAADRYLSLRRDGRAGPWIGTRAARPGEMD